VYDKTGRKGRGQQLRDSRWGRWDPVPNQRQHWALVYLDVCPKSPTSCPMQEYSAAQLGAKTEIPDKTNESRVPWPTLVDTDETYST
jgi:hypothetical protein